MGRFLTKSRFKVGIECPTKLHYLDQPKVFGNQSIDDPFLQALAMGGFQVGELVKIEFPGGIEITETDHLKAWEQTQELLKKHNVTIFEASIMFESCFVKVDVLRKTGDKVELIEVKSKSFDPTDADVFISKKRRKNGIGDLKSEWKPYIADVAFQTFVAKSAFPKLEISPFLMLVDKSSRATIDGLNQLFLLKKNQHGRTTVERDSNLKPSDIGKTILVRVDVESLVAEILADKVVIIDDEKHGVLTFSKTVALLREIHDKQMLVPSELGKKCKDCEFRIKDDLKAQGLKSGFEACWKTALAKEVSGADNFVFDIWNFRGADKLIGDGNYFFHQVDLDEFEHVDDPFNVLQFTPKQRQWLQVKTHNENAMEAVFLSRPLTEAISSFTYPFHFIDFETTAVAIPFFSGGRPYSQVAFQFSHHVMHADGHIEHVGQFFNDAPGVFPNFKFVRALREQLSKDSGTIFRYAAHENTVLCEIARQLDKSSEPDKDELIAWIQTITTRRNEDGEALVGKRSMVDMCELVKLYYYSPHMKGSNSIKKVLPAVLFHSEFLKAKYKKPIYGTTGIKSLNYKNWTWIEERSGKVVDPYKKLPEIFEGMDTSEIQLLMDSSELADGGAAMTAYARMQFTQMTDIERAKLKEALLKYCELDTLAMVMIFEYWLNECLDVSSKDRKAAY